MVTEGQLWDFREEYGTSVNLLSGLTWSYKSSVLVQNTA